MSAEALIQRLAGRQSTTTGTIERFDTTLDNSASPISSWNPHISNIAVVVQLTSGSEGVRYGRENNRDFGTAYVAPGQDITASDRLLWNERYFDIQSVRTPGMMATGQILAFMVLDIEETKENES